MADSDTIAAIATPPGRGGIAIVRISGSEAHSIGAAICGQLDLARKATLRPFHGTDVVLDHGLVIRFDAPHSLTGEDVVELQGHGGPIVAAMVLERCLSLGARAARPGEFSERAYLNDKLDLAQAEAIADMINSATREAAQAAARSLSGEFSHAVHNLVERLTELRMYVEAAIDFPEEEIDFLADDALHARIDALTSDFDALMQRARQGQLLNDGFQVVLRGAPNAGKSSLLNALAGSDTAIVTPVAGTTRDILKESISLDGVPMTLLDTAGVRETDDVIEQEGVRRADGALSAADLAIVMIDSADHRSPSALHAAYEEAAAAIPKDLPTLAVANKIDALAAAERPSLPADWIAISALKGHGLDELRKRLLAMCGFGDATEGSFSARERHLESLRRARTNFDQGCQVLREQRAGELFAEELRAAQQELAEITGEFSSDDLLGRIFGEFCIGK